MTRRNVEVILEITPTAPLTHGAGANGNKQVLARREAVVWDESVGCWTEVSLPMVSGPALRATLREYAVADYLAALNVKPGEIAQHRLRLLVKGGKLGGSTGATESVDASRRMIRLVPLLALFGCMDDEGKRAGSLCVSDVHVHSVTAVKAGVIPQRVASADGSVALTLHGGRPPIPDGMVVTEIQQYRHDLADSRIGTAYLSTDAQIAKDDARVGALATTEERREANESMPYAYEAICPGTPMLAILRLRGASDVDVAVLVRAIARWVEDGGWLGGGRSAGRGSCRVAVRAVHHELVREPVDGVEVAPGHEAQSAEEAVSRVYMAHIAEVGVEARAFLFDAPVGPAPKAPKKGKQVANARDAA